MAERHPASVPVPALPRLLQSGAMAVAGLLAMAWLWGHRRRSRHALWQLGPHHLRDIGLDPGAQRRECAKPPWRR